MNKNKTLRLYAPDLDASCRLCVFLFSVTALRTESTAVILQNFLHPAAQIQKYCENTAKQIITNISAISTNPNIKNIHNQNLKFGIWRKINLNKKISFIV